MTSASECWVVFSHGFEGDPPEVVSVHTDRADAVRATDAYADELVESEEDAEVDRGDLPNGNGYHAIVSNYVGDECWVAAHRYPIRPPVED